jgi:hypothetical protein
VGGAEFARVGGTNGDPRHYGYILIVGLAVYASVFLYARQAMVRYLSVCLAGITIVALIYSASRTATLAGVVVALAAALVYQKTSPGTGRSYSLLAVLAAVFLGGYYFFSTSFFNERMFDIESESFEMSADARQRDLKWAFVEALKDPSIFIIGRGPAKSVVRTSGHSDVGWYFYRFGLAGLACYLLLLWLSLMQGYRLLRVSPSGKDRAPPLAALLVAINWCVFLFSENIFKGPQMMALNMFFIGLLFAAPSSKVARASARNGRRPAPDRARPDRPKRWQPTGALIPPAPAPALPLTPDHRPLTTDPRAMTPDS